MPAFRCYPKDVQLGPDGEILVRGPGMFAGYWRNEEATRQAIRTAGFIPVMSPKSWPTAISASSTARKTS